MIYLFTRGWGEKKESTDDSYTKKKLTPNWRREMIGAEEYTTENQDLHVLLLFYVFGTVFLALIGTHTCFQILMSITKGDKLNKNTRYKRKICFELWEYWRGWDSEWRKYTTILIGRKAVTSSRWVYI